MEEDPLLGSGSEESFTIVQSTVKDPGSFTADSSVFSPDLSTSGLQKIGAGSINDGT